MPVAPDLAGFRDAQSRLRGQLGTDVTFFVPQPASYDPAEPLDPETGRPFDPFVAPTPGTGEPLAEVVRATIANPISLRRDAAEMTPIGKASVNELVLDVAIADRPRIEGATHVEVWGERFEVEEFRNSGLDVADRFLVYATRG